MRTRHSSGALILSAAIASALLLFVWPSLSSVAASPTVTIQPDEEFRATPVDVEKGDSIDYSYDSTGAVSFTIEFFEGGDIVYSHEGSSDDGRYTANETGSYELVFDNLETFSIVLTYSAVEVESGFGLGLVFIVGGIAAAVFVVLGFFAIVRARNSRLPPL